ncbi:MAG TPA: hypothetical protein VMZ05_10880 [Spirochaetota bacterium]|nr:hypothetical protein [Spirochaetota bacterium]
MKKSTQLRILGIIVLIVLAFVDAIPYTSIAALGGIVILLFRPKGFLNLIEKMYE